MTLSTLLIFSFPVLLVVFAWHQSRLNRRALVAAARYSERYGLQLLDQSVVLRSLRPALNADKLPALKRIYRFEFTLKGDRRYRGWVTLVGGRVRRIESQPVAIGNASQLT